jgi:tetratricopeptide (TPR) repeat protein
VGTNLASYGDICLWQGNYEQATEIFEEAFAFAQEFGDRSLIAFYFYSLGFIAWFRGNYAHATQLITDSLELSRDIGYDWLAASSLHALGDIALAKGDDKKASQWYTAELALGEEPTLKAVTVFALHGLGKVAWAQSNYELAKIRFEEALHISQETNFKQGTFHALHSLGRIAQRRDDSTAARAYYAKLLQMQRQRISPPFKWSWLKTYVAAISYPLEGFAVLATTQKQMDRATYLFGAAEALYIPLRFEMSARERAEHDQAIAAARASLGEEAFATAYEVGKKMTLDEAVAYALEDTEANVG